MKNIKFRRCLAQLVGTVFLTSAAIVVHAQTSGLQYKVIAGQVYAYEISNPEAIYLIPNMTPKEVEVILREEASAQAQLNAAAQNGTAGNQAGVSPYNTNSIANGFFNITPVKPAASNSALPAITFRNPALSQRNLPGLANPIGGLPRYPGKNYPSGSLLPP